MKSVKGWLGKHKVAIANLSLILVLLLGGSYLLFGTLRIDPFEGSYKLTLEIPGDITKGGGSGGLQTTSDVAVRGVRIGKVDSLQVQPRSVKAVLKIQDSYKINRDSAIKILSLSGAGEQYVEFEPPKSGGPYWKDGDVIQQSSSVSIHSSVPFSGLLRNSIDVVKSLDLGKLRQTIVELDTALNGDPGSQQVGGNAMRTLLISSGFLFANLNSALPQTQALIENTGTILKTTSDIQPDLSRTVNGVSKLMASLNASDSELRTLLGQGPGQLTSLTGSINQIRDPLTDVLKQFLDIAHQGAIRAPALANLFPSAADGLNAASEMFHDNGWWAMASIYPRPYCEYPVTPAPPTEILQLSLPTNLYCVTQDPTQQIRGADKAPRPAGDDTAGPAPNYDPKARWTPVN